MSYSVFSIISALLAISSAQMFDFTAHRESTRSNNFNLSCITDVNNGAPDRTAIFLLDGRDVRDFGGFPVVNRDGTFSFTLMRELEGIYTCISPTREGVSNHPQTLVDKFKVRDIIYIIASPVHIKSLKLDVRENFSSAW